MFLFLAQYVQSESRDGIYNYPDDSHNLLEASLRFLMPELPSGEGMVFLNFGYGFHYPLVPHIVCPGIFLDAGIGLDWLAILSDNEEDKDKDKEKKRDYKQLGLNLGLRVYNLIEFGFVDINPFVGYNLILGQLDRRAPWFFGSPVIGVSLAIKFVGIEYCYYVPTKFSNNVGFHHAAIVFHLKLRGTADEFF